MGIKDLSKLIADQAPSAIKENEIKNYFGACLFFPTLTCLSCPFIFSSSLSRLPPHQGARLRSMRR